MNVYDHRRRVLQALVDEFFDGQGTKLARKMGLSGQQVNRWLKYPSIDKPETSRNIGEKAARDIERALDLPPGTLDGTTGAEVVIPAFINEISDLEWEMISNFKNLTKAQQDAALSDIRLKAEHNLAVLQELTGVQPLKKGRRSAE